MEFVFVPLVPLLRLTIYDDSAKNKTTKQTPWHLVRKRTTPTEPPPLIGKF
jgi:hypothetical protein